MFHENEHEDGDHCVETYSDADWSGNRVTRKTYGAATFVLTGAAFHHMCRSHRTVSLSSCESEYAVVSASCEGIYLRAFFRFMADSPCSLHLTVDNAACRQLALRQGVGKTRHIEGRMLWTKYWTLVQFQVLLILGDLSTKMHPCHRLRCLLFMRGFVDVFTCEPVGADDHQNLILRQKFCATLKQVKGDLCKQAASMESCARWISEPHGQVVEVPHRNAAPTTCSGLL